MKTLKLWLLATAFVIGNSQLEEKFALKILESADFTALEAIKGVLKDFFVPNEPKVDLFSCRAKTFAMELPREKPEEIVMRVKNLDLLKNVILARFSIILMESEAPPP
jgi:hypothetical protein